MLRDLPTAKHSREQSFGALRREKDDFSEKKVTLIPLVAISVAPVETDSENSLSKSAHCHYAKLAKVAKHSMRASGEET